jgi:ATP-dependent exoDNAse (exonuclease V) beta subunit
MSGPFIPQDQDVRIRIRESLDENLFVVAGAGTGKTSSLVDRIVALVASGRSTLDRVAAITFTESAAAELRDRIRESLERAVAEPERLGEEQARCFQGVADLDRAAIQTLHSFAGSLLRERPLEAGLPPIFDTLDPIAADTAFGESWGTWLDYALDDHDLQPALRMGLSLGLTLDHLYQAARSVHANYDLLEDATFSATPPSQPEAAAALVAAASELERLCAFGKKGDDDPLATHVHSVVGIANRLKGMNLDSVAAWRMLAESLPLRQRQGKVGDWETDPESQQNACTRLKSLLLDLDGQAQEDLAVARASCIMPLLRAVRDFVLEYSEERKRQGDAEYQDLLVWARNLLRDNLEVRDYFREHYTHILVDEAQDTDPVQAEIATFLAEEVAPGTPSQIRPRRWTDVSLSPGKLFVVGDSKQSIYRFRRADIVVMAKFQRLIAEEPLRLVQNFRSQRPLVAWINHLFQGWMQSSDCQASYIPIVHRWEPNTDYPKSASVWALGGPLEERTVGSVRRQEAGRIATLVQNIKAGEWLVMDQEATKKEGTEQFRPAQFKDICILMPQRSALRSLEIALEDGDVPFRLEGASLVFGTQEVRDLLNCLSAMDDPADQVALVAALRSPALACSDADLLEFVEDGGRLDILAENNATEGPVAEALEILRRYHEQRMWTSTASLIEEFVRERRLLGAALGSSRYREKWRRYSFLVGQARAYTESARGSLRAFLEWAATQANEGARVTEVPVPETDEDAVRVMTVHGAKGLEFPIVVLTALNFEPSARVGSVLFDRERGKAEVSLGSAGNRFQTPGYETLAQQEEEQGLAEDVRLMYVATTRARDHLVISLYRTVKDQKSRAALIAKYMEDADDLWHPATIDKASPPVASQEAEGPYPEDTSEARQQWIDERAQLLRERARPSSVAATALAQVVKDEAEITEEPWRRGRAGTNVGRAVHAVLQTVDLATGQGLEDTARAQAAAEGVTQREAEVVRLARVALESDTVKRAVASERLWREVPVAAPVGETVLEGFIDLLFEEEGALIVVDYKTDSLETEEDIAARSEHYRIQVGAYALALQEATGMSVKEVILIFLQPAQEVILSDVPALVSEAKQALLSVQDEG